MNTNEITTKKGLFEVLDVWAEKKKLVTKQYLSSELDSLVERKQLVTKDFLSKEFIKFEEKISKNIDEKFNHYVGVMLNILDERFQAIIEIFSALPEDNINIKKLLDDHDTDIKENIKPRISLLEREVFNK